MRETEILRGLGKARMQHTAPGYAKGVVPLGLRRGIAQIKGPGTSTSDSIHGVSLSKGEAVLPAKTVQAVGPKNIEQLITSTNGAPPAKGLRAGEGYADGVLPKEINISDYDKPSLKVTGDDIERAQRASNARPSISESTRVLGNAGEGIDMTKTQPPKAAPAGLAGRVKQAWDGAKGSVASGVENGSDAVKSGLQKAKLGVKILGAGTGSVLEGVNAYGDINTPGMSDLEKANRGVEGVSRVAGGLGGYAAGASAGALGQALVPIPGLGFGMGVVGGYLGGKYLPKIVNRLTNGPDTQLPSERAADLRSQGEKLKVSAPSVDVAKVDPRQTDSVLTRTNVSANTLGRDAGPLGRTPNPTLQAQPSGPDLTSQLASAPGTLPAGLRDGVIYRTAGANGNPVYSGRNVGYDPSTPTQMVDGQGRNLARKGGLYNAAAGAPVAMGDGGFAITPSGAAKPPADSVAGTPEVSAALRAASARGDTDAVRSFYQKDGGNFQGLSAAQPSQQQTSPMEDRLMAELQKGNLTRAGARLLQALAQNRITAEGNQMQYRSSMAGHDVARQGYELTYATGNNRLALDRSKIGHEMRMAAQEGVMKDVDNSPLIISTGTDGKTYKDEGKRNYLLQQLKAMTGKMTMPDGKPVSLEDLYSRGDGKYHQMMAAAQAGIELGNTVNEYAKSPLFGAQSGWAAPNITDVRETGIEDYPKGLSLVDAALAKVKPGYYSKGVEVDVGGRKQMIPLGKLLDSPHGGEHRRVINEWRVAHGFKPLGDMASGN